MNTWHCITIGHLSRNKFWGEAEYGFFHPVLATSTVIQSEHGTILVDPSMEAKSMGEAVFHCSGVKPEEIDLVYCTHMHADHWMGLDAFPNAHVFMPEEDVAYLRGIRSSMNPEMQKALGRIQGVQNELVPGFKLIHLPGHTAGLHGLLFDGPEGRVLVSGDAVMNKEFFQHGEGYFYSFDLKKSAESIQKAAQVADYIIPGHGEGFLVKAYPAGEAGPEYGEVKNSVTVGDIIVRPDGMKTLLSQLPAGFNAPGMEMARDLPIEVVLTSGGYSPDAIEAWKRDFLTPFLEKHE